MEGNRGKNIATIIIVILVGLGSFGLGRLSKDASSNDFKITYPNQPANVISATESTQGTYNSSLNSNFVQQTPKTSQINNKSKSSTSSVGKIYFASSRGNKYYHIGCGGGKTLKPENKIYFTTEAEAQAAGYQKSSTCK